jgi:hypothetical protein
MMAYLPEGVERLQTAIIRQSLWCGWSAVMLQECDVAETLQGKCTEARMALGFKMVRSGGGGGGGSGISSLFCSPRAQTGR